MNAGASPLTGADIIGMAVDHCARYPGAVDEIRDARSRPVLDVRYSTDGSGWRISVSAQPCVRLSDGTLAAAADPVVWPTFRLRRGQQQPDLARWAGRKACPVARDVEVVVARAGHARAAA